ncbi:MAG: DUF2079 domain-containing protein [Polyangiaceae bacterium]|nr:DUF2079 domain-containing protein [Polyangiaceae bacterium]
MTEPRSQLPGLARALCLLNLEAASAALAIAYATLGDRLLSYVGTNALEREARSSVMLGIAAAMGVATLVALILGAKKHGGPRLESIALRLSPVLVFPVLPLAARWELWESRPLALLVMTGVVGLLLRSLLIVAWRQPPIFGRSEGGSMVRLAHGSRALLSKPSLDLPLATVSLAAAAYAIYFSVITVRAHWYGYTSTYDLGIEHNILWNTTHFSSPLFKCSPLRGPTGGHFSLHATFIAFALAPIYALAQRAETLLIIQAVLLAAGAIPLYLLGRSRIGGWPAALVAVCYLLYAPLHGSNLYHFHYLTLAPFFVLATAAALQSRRLILMAIFAALALSVREDIGLGLAALGAYFVLSGERPWPGAALAVSSLLFSVIMKMVLMPNEGGGASFLYMYEGIIPKGETGAGGILKTVLGNPGYLAHALLTGDRLTYLLQILVPVLFLPLRKPLTLIMLVSGFAFTLLTGRSAVANSLSPIMISFQYTAHFTPYVFVATIIGLGTMKTESLETPRSGTLSFMASLLALAVATLITSYHFGAVLQHNTAMGGFYKFAFTPTEQDRAGRIARDKVLSVIPPRVPVAASDCVVPHVSNRANAYNFSGNPFDAEYVVSAYGIPCTPSAEPILALLRGTQFGVVAFAPPYVVLKRGAPTTRNHEVMLAIRSGRPSSKGF